MKIPLHLFLLLALFTLAACGPKTTAVVVETSEARSVSLTDLMVGSFDSSEQARLDSSYYDITLHMYPIWTERELTYLYVEQSVTSMPMKPYRQRVYVVEQLEDKSYKSAVYKLEHDSLFIGKWKTPSFFDQYSPDILIEREGCAVYMQEMSPGRFEGSTREKECGSTMRGASYATSHVLVEKGKVTSWDQGFNAEGEQVWGAVDGPYIFLTK